MAKEHGKHHGHLTHMDGPKRHKGHEPKMHYSKDQDGTLKEGGKESLHVEHHAPSHAGPSDNYMEGERPKGFPEYRFSEEQGTEPVWAGTEFEDAGPIYVGRHPKYFQAEAPVHITDEFEHDELKPGHKSGAKK